MENIMGVTGCAVIAVVCYLAGLGLKAWDVWDDRKIPVAMGLVGAILGLLSYRFWPVVIPSQDPITAAAVGIVSGLAATGINQIYKQALKGDENDQ